MKEQNTHSKLLQQSISSLEEWLESWKDKKQGIHGFIVHHHLDALEFIAPDTWTQSSAILAHLLLFEKTREKKFLQKAVKEAEFLEKTFNQKEGFFENSNFEQKHPDAQIKASLIHNAYPALALLKTAKAIGKQTRLGKKFLKAGKNCCEKFIIGKCWSEKKQAFCRGIEEQNPEFVLNMASSACLALIALDELEEKSTRLEKYCGPCVQQVLKHQKNDGAFPYSDRSRLEISLYQGLTMQGLLEFYRKTKNPEVLQALEKARDWLYTMLDKKTCLFYHRKEKGKLFKYPEFFAGSLVPIQQLKTLEEFSQTPKDSESAEKLAEKICRKQFKNGAFAGFFAFSDVFMPLFYPAEPEVKKWRDVLPIPGWNALAFFALAHFVPAGAKLPKSRARFPEIFENSDFEITESKTQVIFKDSVTKEIVAKWTKSKDFCDFCAIPVRKGEERKKHAREVFERRNFAEKFVLRVAGKAPKN